MKKIILLIISIFCLQSIVFSQSIDEMRKEIQKESKDEKLLKEFNSYIVAYSELKNSIVLSKNTWYKWYTYVTDPELIQISLSDNNDHPIFQNKSNQNGVISFSFKCNKTNVYNLSIRNLSSKDISTIVEIYFVGMFEPKNIDKITPIIEETDEIIAITSHGISNSDDKPKETEYEEIFFVVEEMPKFNGKNTDEFKNYIKNELKYPQEAIDNKIEGRVFVQFTVDKYGYIKDAKVVRGLHPALNQEALRILYSSPKWEPGKQRKQSVNVTFTFPVIFKLP